MKDIKISNTNAVEICRIKKIILLIKAIEESYLIIITDSQFKL